MTKTLAEFRIDGGFDFHQVWLDLPYGKYQLLWEIHSETIDPKKIVKVYHAAIDDIAITEVTCTKLRKFKVFCYPHVLIKIYVSVFSC